MGVEIRTPIGLMFTVFGVILVVYGLVSDRAIYARSLGININLAWGLVLMVFGAAMLLAGLRRGRGRGEREPGADAPGGAGDASARPVTARRD
jgi:hypothetical protein